MCNQEMKISRVARVLLRYAVFRFSLHIILMCVCANRGENIVCMFGKIIPEETFSFLLSRDVWEGKYMFMLCLTHSFLVSGIIRNQNC